MESAIATKNKFKSATGGILAKMEFRNSSITPITKIEYNLDNSDVWQEVSTESFNSMIVRPSTTEPDTYTIENLFVPLPEINRDYYIEFRLTNIVGVSPESIGGIGRTGSEPADNVIAPELMRLPYVSQYMGAGNLEKLKIYNSNKTGLLEIVFRYSPMLDGGDGVTPVNNITVSFDGQQTWANPFFYTTITTTKDADTVIDYGAGQGGVLRGVGSYIVARYNIPQGGDFTDSNTPTIHFKPYNVVGPGRAVQVHPNLPYVVATLPKNPGTPQIDHVVGGEIYRADNFNNQEGDFVQDVRVYLQLPEHNGFGEPYIMYSNQTVDLDDYDTVTNKNIVLNVTPGNIFRKNGRIKVYSQSNPRNLWFVGTITDNNRSSGTLNILINEKASNEPYKLTANVADLVVDSLKSNRGLRDIAKHPIDFPYLSVYVGNQLRDDDVYVADKIITVANLYRPSASFQAKIVITDRSLGSLTLKVLSKTESLLTNPLAGYWEISANPDSNSQNSTPAASDWVLEPMYGLLEVFCKITNLDNNQKLLSIDSDLIVEKNGTNTPTLGYFTVKALSDIVNYRFDIQYQTGGIFSDSFSYNNSPVKQYFYSGRLDTTKKILFTPLVFQPPDTDFLRYWILLNRMPTVSKTNIKFNLPHYRYITGLLEGKNVAVLYRKRYFSISEDETFGDFKFYILPTHIDQTSDVVDVTLPIDEISYINANNKAVRVSYDISIIELTRNLLEGADSQNDEKIIAELELLKDKIPTNISVGTIHTPGGQEAPMIRKIESVGPTVLLAQLFYDDEIPANIKHTAPIFPNGPTTREQQYIYMSSIEYSVDSGATWHTALKPTAYDDFTDKLTLTLYPPKHYASAGSSILDIIPSDVAPTLYVGDLVIGAAFHDLTYITEIEAPNLYRLSKPQKVLGNVIGSLKVKVPAKHTSTSTSEIAFELGFKVFFTGLNLDYFKGQTIKIINASLSGSPARIASRPFMTAEVQEYNSSTGRLAVEVKKLTTSTISGSLDNLGIWDVVPESKRPIYIEKLELPLSAYKNASMHPFAGTASETKNIDILITGLEPGETYDVWVRANNSHYGPGKIVKSLGVTTALVPLNTPDIAVKIIATGLQVFAYPSYNDYAIPQEYQYAIAQGASLDANDPGLDIQLLLGDRITGLVQSSEYTVIFRTSTIYGVGPWTEPKTYKTAAPPSVIPEITGMSPRRHGTDIVIPTEVELSLIEYQIQYKLSGKYYTHDNKLVTNTEMQDKLGFLEDNVTLNLDEADVVTYFAKFRVVNELGASEWSREYCLSTLTRETRAVKVKWIPGPSSIIIKEIGLVDIDLQVDQSVLIKPPIVASTASTVRYEYAKLFKTSPKIILTGKDRTANLDTGKPSWIQKEARWNPLVGDTIPLTDEENVVIIFRALNDLGGIHMTELLRDENYTGYIYNFIEPYGLSVKSIRYGPERNTGWQDNLGRNNPDYMKNIVSTAFTAHTPIPKLDYSGSGRYIKYQEELFAPFTSLKFKTSKPEPLIDFTLDCFVPTDDKSYVVAGKNDRIRQYPDNKIVGNIYFYDISKPTSEVLVRTRSDAQALTVGDKVIIPSFQDSINFPYTTLEPPTPGAEYSTLEEALAATPLANRKRYDAFRVSVGYLGAFEYFWWPTSNLTDTGVAIMRDWPTNVAPGTRYMLASVRSSGAFNYVSDPNDPAYNREYLVTFNILNEGALKSRKYNVDETKGGLPPLISTYISGVGSSLEKLRQKNLVNVIYPCSQEYCENNRLVHGNYYKPNPKVFFTSPNWWANTGTTDLTKYRTGTITNRQYPKEMWAEITITGDTDQLPYTDGGIVWDHPVDPCYKGIGISWNSARTGMGLQPGTPFEVPFKDPVTGLGTTYPCPTDQDPDRECELMEYASFDGRWDITLQPNFLTYQQFSPDPATQGYAIGYFGPNIPVLKVNGSNRTPIGYRSSREGLKIITPMNTVIADKYTLSDWLHGAVEIPDEIFGKFNKTKTIANISMTMNAFNRLVLFVDLGLAYRYGQAVVVRSATDATAYFLGAVEKYNQQTGELRINVTSQAGSGSSDKWIVDLADYPTQQFDLKHYFKGVFAYSFSDFYDIPHIKYNKNDIVLDTAYKLTGLPGSEIIIENFAYKSKVDDNSEHVSNTDYWEKVNIDDTNKAEAAHPTWPVPQLMYPLQPPDPPMVIDIIEETDRIGFTIKPPYFKLYNQNSTQVDDFLSANYYDGGMHKDAPLVFRASLSEAFTKTLSSEDKKIYISAVFPIFFNFAVSVGVSELLFIPGQQPWGAEMTAFSMYARPGDQLTIIVPGKIDGVYIIKSITAITHTPDSEWQGATVWTIQYNDPAATQSSDPYTVYLPISSNNSIYIEQMYSADVALTADVSKSRYETNTYWLNNCKEDTEYLICVRLDNGWLPKLMDVHNTYTQPFRVRTPRKAPPKPAIDSVACVGDVFKLNYTYGTSPVALYSNWQEITSNEYGASLNNATELPYSYGISFALTDDKLIPSGEATVARTKYTPGQYTSAGTDYGTHRWARLLALRNSPAYAGYRWPTDEELRDMENDARADDQRSGWGNMVTVLLNSRADAWFLRYKIPETDPKFPSGKLSNVVYLTSKNSYPYNIYDGAMGLSTVVDDYVKQPNALTPVGLKNDPRGRAYLTSAKPFWDHYSDAEIKLYQNEFISPVSNKYDMFGDRPTAIPIYSVMGKTIQDSSRVCGLLYTADEYNNKHPYYQTYSDDMYLSVYRAPYRPKYPKKLTDSIYGDIDTSGYSYSHVNSPVHYTRYPENTTYLEVIDTSVVLNTNGFYIAPTTLGREDNNAHSFAAAKVHPTSLDIYRNVLSDTYHHSPYYEFGIVKASASEPSMDLTPFSGKGITPGVKAYAELITPAFPGMWFSRGQEYSEKLTYPTVKEDFYLYREKYRYYYGEPARNTNLQDLVTYPLYSSFDCFSAVEQEEYYAVTDFAVNKFIGRNFPTYMVYVCQSQNICCAMSSGNSSGINKDGELEITSKYPTLLPLEHKVDPAAQIPYVPWGYDTAVPYKETGNNPPTSAKYGYKGTFPSYDRYVWPYLTIGERFGSGRLNITSFGWPESHMTPIEQGNYDASWSARNTIQLGRNIVGDGVGEDIKNLKLSQPTHVAVDMDNNIYISDTGNKKIKRIAPNKNLKNPAAHPSQIENVVNYGTTRTLATLDEFPGQIEVNYDGSIITYLAGGKLYRRINGVNYLVTTENQNTTNKIPAKNYQWPIYGAVWGKNIPEDYDKQFISSFIQTTSGGTIFLNNGRGRVVKINCMTTLTTISHVEYSFDNVLFVRYNDSIGIPIPASAALGSNILMYFRTVGTNGMYSQITQIYTDNIFKVNESVNVLAVSANLQFVQSDVFIHKDGTSQNRPRFQVTPGTPKTSLSDETFVKNNITLVQSSRVDGANNSAFVLREAKQRLSYVRKIMQLKSTTPTDLVNLKKEEEMALKLIATPTLTGLRDTATWRFRTITGPPVQGISKYDFLEMDITINFTASRNTGITSENNPTQIPYTDYTVIIKNTTKNRIFEIASNATKYKYIKEKSINPSTGVITYVVRFYNDPYVTESNSRFRHWRTRPIFEDSPPPAYEYHRVPRQLTSAAIDANITYKYLDTVGKHIDVPLDAALDRGWYSNEYVEFLGPDFSKGDTLEIYLVPDKTKYSKLANYTAYTITMDSVTNAVIKGVPGQVVTY